MRKAAMIVSLLGVVVCAFFLARDQNYIAKPEHETSKQKDDDKREGRGERDGERAFFERLHYPYGVALPPQVMKNMWDEIGRLPREEDIDGPNTTSWQCLGPFGAAANYLPSPNAVGRYTGRVLDLEVVDGVGLRFAAASGGLWSTAAIVHFPISDDVTSLAVSTFDTKPGDPNTIILGTGEASAGRTGTGLWQTTDAGATWRHIDLPFSNPRFFFRVRYDPVVPNLIHAVANDGYYRSTNNGEVWTSPLGGWLTDIAFGSSPVGRVCYIARHDFGLYRSTTDGLSWQRVRGSGIPDSGNAGTLITSMFVPSTQNSVFYVSMHRADRDSLLGVYKSTDAGYTWTPTLGSFSYRVDYGGYTGAIAVCPTNPNIVLVGWIKSYRTQDGGRTWVLIDDLHPDNHDNTHDDWQQFYWLNNGFVYAANDGGIFYSQDYGVTWRPAANNSPITQFYTVAVGGPGNNIIFGGAQDNGIMRSTDGGLSWLNVRCCDGAGVAILPALLPPPFGAPVAVMNGSFPWQGERWLTLDYGNAWNRIDQGLSVGGLIRSDPSGMLYTVDGSSVYRSSNNGGSWAPMNTLFPNAVRNITIGAYDQFLGRTIYAPLDTTAGARLRVWYNGGWYDRSAGLPSGMNIRKVIPHPTFAAEAYLVLEGLFSGEKIYYTQNRGLSWTNVTHGFPNIPVTDVAVHPSYRELIVAGTEMGCYKTLDFGVTWYPWNHGMPKANIISELTLMDNTASTGEVSVVAASYGRSIWKRDFMTSDPGRTIQVRRIRKPINDFTTIRDTVQFTPPAGGTIIRAAIRIDSLLHQRNRDVIAVLVHQGVRDTLLYHHGAEGQNFVGTDLSDEAPLALTDGQAPFTGPFRPYRPLSQFVNISAEGDWYLEVSDDGPGATGMLIGWSLMLDYQSLTRVDENPTISSSFKLYQNYPNPFNPVTTIKFQIPRAGRTALKVYDLAGREVRTLVEGDLAMGNHEVEFNANGLASGVYLYRLTADGFTAVKKLVLLK